MSRRPSRRQRHLPEGPWQQQAGGSCLRRLAFGSVDRNFQGRIVGKMKGLRHHLRKFALCAQLVVILVGELSAHGAQQVQVCFSPPPKGGCDPTVTIVQEINAAHKTVLVQAYALTSREITSALLEAKHRGLDVRAIVDRSQLHKDRSDAFAVQRLAIGGVPVWVDTISGIAHSKVIVIDSNTVITGSFNFTWSAEHKNVENLLIVRDSSIAAQYEQNWNARVQRSRPVGPSATKRRESNTSPGSIVGNRKSKIYAWPGCGSYDTMSPANRIEFPSREAADAAGYRVARNCP
jgi:phosphatidylserine/phosphatidylglycerophosphate/cardiolipin synthase-like enzyme